MSVIDVDPELLKRSADAALHSAEQAAVHLQAEFVDELDGLMDTLVAEGPYAYTQMWKLAVEPDGSVSFPITTTRDGIRDGYGELHELMATATWESMVEVRGEWYTFHEGTGTGWDKSSGAFLDGVGTSILLLPVSTAKGITGELVWNRMPGMALGRGADANPAPFGSDGEFAARRALLAQHDRFLEALRAGDVDAVLEVLSVDAQSAVRDYVDDTGTLVALDGAAAHRAHFDAFFARYRVEAVDLLHRVVADWYVFAEVRFTLSDGARTVAFNTAEMIAPGHDGRLLVRIGHGTDPA
ncbi:MAG TPA: nuclear transport factor 2 family protein [Acidimicrobiales bacterium]